MNNKVIEITEDKIDLFEIKDKRILSHKQIERRQGMIFMRMKLKSLY